MKIIRLVAVCLAMVLPGLAGAQSTDAKSFGSYWEMREVLDRHMQAIDLESAFGALLPPGAVDPGRLANAQDGMRGSLPPFLENATIFVNLPYENGMSRQVIAYWTGTSYLYAQISYHDRADGLVVFQLNVNTVLAEIMAGL